MNLKNYLLPRVMTLKLLLFLSLGLTMVSCQGKETTTANYEVVPKPLKIEINDGANPFILSKTTTITYPASNERLKKTAEFLSEYLRLETGVTLDVSDKATGKNEIILKADLSDDNKEAYRLVVTNNTITINGSSDAGVFYGIQTLRKSIASDAENKKVLLPAVEINDQPRFGYRGMMLDVSRHFAPVEFIKKFIDLIALHNLNIFHWHLTDDQGWRIEIKSRPKLAEIASMRKETFIGSKDVKPLVYDGKPYGGYYTQDEIKEVVKYAQDRFITVIPEINAPGHMLAALSAYPELGCTGGPYDAATTWGIFEDVLCAGNEDVFAFLEDVFTEVVELFPSKYIHIGGDECPKVRWRKCPKCQAKAKELGLKKTKEFDVEAQLQSYFVHRVEKFLNSLGKNIIGWDEILQGGLAPNATVMSWRGIKGGIQAAQLGHDVIMTPNSFLYFDYYQSADKENEPLGIGKTILPIEKVYSFEPFPEILTASQRNHIIGVQANMWAEYMPTTDHREYMLLPRLAALSEIQWMPMGSRNYDDFLDRLGRIIPMYEKLGYNFAKHTYKVSMEVKDKTVHLRTLNHAPIHYTTDGSEPTEQSELYTGPFVVGDSTTLKAIALHPDKKIEVMKVIIP